MVQFIYDYRTKLYLFAAGQHCTRLEQVDNTGSFIAETMVCVRKGRANLIEDVYHHLMVGEEVPMYEQNELYNVLSSVMKGKNIVN